jgi:L-alanine-DL-glutamate epimerase-like enolase superfamily enzyme
VELRVTHRTLRFWTPLRTSFGEVASRDLFAVELHGGGVVGLGEAAPLEAYDGVPAAAVARALARYAEVLGEFNADAPGHLLLDACRKAAELPEALAAVDMALWDRAGKRSDRPVAALLRDDHLEAVAVNATLGALDRAGAAAAAHRAAADGFSCVKVKVGTGDDAGRVAAVRAALGPAIALRLDANGAWDVETAVRMIGVLAPAGLELVEEPVHGLAAMREVRARVATRVSIDETAGEPGALTAAVADAVCLKIGRCGGISGLLAQAALVRATGADGYVASTMDGPLGIAAGVHAAAALKIDLACGLATLEHFEGLEEPESLRVVDGVIRVPVGPGLGVA